MKRLGDYIVGAAEHITTEELRSMRYPVREMVQDRLARRIAAHLVELHTQETTGEHATTFRCEVYVIPVQDLHQMIRSKAQDLVMYLYRK